METASNTPGAPQLMPVAVSQMVPQLAELHTLQPSTVGMVPQQDVQQPQSNVEQPPASLLFTLPDPQQGGTPQVKILRCGRSWVCR